MSDSILGYVIENLRAAKYSRPAIARAAGVPLGSLTKILYGTTANPRVDNVEKLYRYFKAKESERAA